MIVDTPKYTHASLFHNMFLVFLVIVFGSVKTKGMRDPEKHNSVRLIWIITLPLLSSLFAISSHMPFILVSWLTDTSKASSVAITCFAVLLYFFLIFRQCYSANVKFNPKFCCWSIFLILLHNVVVSCAYPACLVFMKCVHGLP